MFNFIAGVVLGFMVATMGFTGIAQALDSGVAKVSNISISVDEKK